MKKPSTSLIHVFRVVFNLLILLSISGIAYAQTQDTMPPVVTGFSFTPGSIDTTTGAQTVTVTVTATDDLSGVSFGCVVFASPSRQQSHESCFSTPISGTVLNGTYQTVITFP